MDNSDMVYSSKQNSVIAGGYNVDNIFMNTNTRPYVTANQLGGSVSASISAAFKHLAVPAGLLFLQHSINPQMSQADESSVQVVENTLYDKLLSMVSSDKELKSHKHTRKNRKSKRLSHNKTKRAR